MNWWIFKDVRFHNGAACVHFILDSAGCCHFQRSFLLCLNNNVIDFVVALHLNQLVSAVLHFGEEVRVILPDATGFRIIVVYGEITLVRGEHSGKVHFLYLIALDILEEAFLFGKRIKAVCIRMEALEHFIWRKSGVFIRNHEIILCGELIIRCSRSSTTSLSSVFWIAVTSNSAWKIVGMIISSKTALYRLTSARITSIPSCASRRIFAARMLEMFR